MADRRKYEMLGDRMKRLQLPLIAMAIWAFGLGAIGLLAGGLFWIVGLLFGALIGSYAAFGVSPFATALRLPAVLIAGGLSAFSGGGK